MTCYSVFFVCVKENNDQRTICERRLPRSVPLDALVGRRDSIRRCENWSGGELPLLDCRRDTPLRAKPRVGLWREGEMPAPFGSSARRLQGDVHGSAERAKRPHSASSGGFQPSRKSFFQSLNAAERAALLKVAPSLRCARRRRPRASTPPSSPPVRFPAARPPRPSRRRVEASHATDPSPTVPARRVHGGAERRSRPPRREEEPTWTCTTTISIASSQSREPRRRRRPSRR